MKVNATFCLLALAFLGEQTANALSSEVKDAIKMVVKYPPHIDVKPGSFIVELDGEPGIRSAQAVATIAKTAKSNLSGSTARFSIGKQYHLLFSGFSVNADEDFDPALLASLPGVKRVWPVKLRTMPAEPSTANFTYPYMHHATGVNSVVQNLGFTGKGVKIGIIDSGVDFNHPELGNCWKTPGCMWQYGADFVGDNYDSRDSHAVINPLPRPMDCMGHGTHVAGIIAAQGPKVTGVAPDATMGMYRVFSCPKNGHNPSSDDVILSAVEAAYKDGHDILSLSLGGGGWPEDPLAVACSNLVKKGVIVVAANGNEGTSGLFTAGSPALGRGVISVGSVDNWNNTGSAISITTNSSVKSIMSSTPGNEEIPFFFDKETQLVAVKDESGSDLGCTNTTQSLSGKIALIKRGVCTFDKKAVNAQAAGAVGVIIYNNVEGMLSPSITDPTINIPVVIITEADGKFALDGLSTGDATVKAPKGDIITVESTTGGQMSPFSSFGPSPELDIAPLVSGPGGNIYSTFPLKLGGYTSLSGTSMATPYITGTIALFKQAHPEYTVGQIRRALITSAKPRVSKATGYNIHPYKSGGGLVNIYDAITARAHFFPPVLSINDTTDGLPDGDTRNFIQLGMRWAQSSVTIKNLDDNKSARIALTNAASESLSSWFANGTFSAVPRTAPESFDPVPNPSIFTQVFAPQLLGSNLLAPGEQRELEVFIVSPFGLKEEDRFFYGGYLNFTLIWDGEKDSPKTYTIPYAGFNGNYRKQDVLSDPKEELPILTDDEGNPVSELDNFGVNGSKPLVANFRLELPTRIISLTLLDPKNKTLGFLPEGYGEYVPRNQQGPSSFISYSIINGTVFEDKEATQPVQVPPGNYRVRLQALRPFGDPGKQTDFQIWDSPMFSVS